MLNRLTLFSRAIATTLALAGFLAGCGGGGGGGGDTKPPEPPQVDGPVLTFTPGTVTGSARAGESTPISVSATARKPSDFSGSTAVFAFVVDPSGAILPSVQVTQPSPGTFHATLQTAPSLAVGTHQGNFTVRVCRDAACATHFAGSPMQLPFSITVTPPAAAPMTAVPAAALSDTVYTNAAAKAAVSVAVTAPGRTWSATPSAPWIKLAGATGKDNGSFTVAYDHTVLDAASHTGSIVVKADNGETVTLGVALTVLAPAFTVSNGSVTFTGINGDFIPSASVQFGLTQGTLTWSATSDQPWLTMTPTGGSTPGITSLSVAPAGTIASGSHTATITVRAPKVADLTVPVTMNLTKATLAVPSQIMIGGANGRDFSTPTSIHMTLNTGYSHQWNITGMPAWASASAVEGFTNKTGVSVLFTPVLGQLPVGTTSVSASVTARVNGDVITEPLNLTINVDRRKLLFSETGVALSSTPGWSRLSRTVTVRDNFGLKPNWSASADQAWLSVTRSGDQLTLTADPASLPSDAISVATVSLSSTDAGVTAPEPLRVAFWKGSTTPGAAVRVNASYTNMIADPIRPYVYAHRAGSSIDVYNVYTGALVSTVADLGPALGNMTVSPNGDYLYAYTYGTSAWSIVKVDLRTMSKVATWALTHQVDQYTTLLAVRPNGVELVLGNHDFIYLATTGQMIAKGYINGPMVATADGARVFAHPSTASMASHFLDYSDMGGGAVSTYATTTTANWVLNNGVDLAVSADGSRLYSANGTMRMCTAVDSATLALGAALPGGVGTSFAQNIEIASDGRIYCGVTDNTFAYDVWAYSAQGAWLKSYTFRAAAGKELLPRSLQVSGDGMIMAGLTTDPTLTFIPVGP